METKPALLNLISRYSLEPIELILEGKADALRQLAAILEQPASSPYHLNRPDHSPSPYTGFLEILQIIQTDTPLRVKRQENKLLIIGSEIQFMNLAHQVQSLANESERISPRLRPHFHVEYYEGSEDVMADSDPFVVSA
ncbi:MAG TPA: hypothetical protein VHO69_05520 [Phototrophicaceae bacterium]|nr:hypothetical protein [Phototrophicaceae bacterium]